ncbi:MAG TPA: hypothetical protein VK327_03640 [Candidatus Paceibacterota bacterium]|nr:hypothetical protein [Candidatus Paceibacterota bacterium]
MKRPNPLAIVIGFAAVIILVAAGRSEEFSAGDEAKRLNQKVAILESRVARLDGRLELFKSRNPWLAEPPTIWTVPGNPPSRETWKEFEVNGTKVFAIPCATGPVPQP